MKLFERGAMRPGSTRHFDGINFARHPGLGVMEAIPCLRPQIYIKRGITHRGSSAVGKILDGDVSSWNNGPH